MIQRIGRASFRHPMVTVVAWLVGLALIVLSGSAVGSQFVSSGRMPGTDSQAAADLLKRSFPAAATDTATIVLQADTSLSRPSVKAVVGAFISRIDHIVRPGAVSVSAVSANGKTVLYDVAMPDPKLKARDGSPLIDTVVRQLQDAAKGPRDHGMRVEFSGGWFAGGSVPANSEAVGLTVAVLVLLLLFGSLIALGVTLLPALLAVLGSSGLVTLLTHVIPTPDVTTQVATMIGLGVGIDYALLMVARFRVELVTHEPEAAFAITLRTAGRSVVLAGATVAVALLGMLLLRLDFIRGLAVGGAVAVLTAVLAALTLQPALMRWSAPSMTKRVRARADRTQRVGRWERWGTLVVARPVAVFVTGLVIVSVLAIPALAMRLSYADASSDPAASTSHKAYVLTSQAFGPGFLGPLAIVVENPSRQGIEKLTRQLAAVPGIVEVAPAATSKDGTVAVLSAIPSTGPQTTQTEALVHRLRDVTIPKSGVVAHIGGQTAGSIDFSELMRGRLPAFIGGVLLLSFIMLMLVFRSIMIPLQAVVLNLLSITAAFGVTVAIFQWGWFANLFGLAGGAPIDPWIPMLLFAIVFGLSMDYEVFLLSAIKERHDQTKDTNSAIVGGLSSTARIITAAAGIMVAVFGAFVTSDIRSVQLVGFGLAIAVLIDATVVRMLLVPSAMALVGRFNWWLPRLLADKLPHVKVEDAAAAAPAQVPSLVGDRQ
jgi:RND superfamily putative drug exporter